MNKLLITFSAFIFFFFFFLVYSGLFSKVTLDKKRVPERWIIYEIHKGNYEKSRTVLEYVKGSLYMEKAVEYSKTFGLYLDDPKAVEPDQLRSVMGVILDNPNAELIKYLQTRYKVARFPTCYSAVVEFPYKNIFSTLIGMARVYPVFEEYFEKQKVKPLPPILEVYDNKNDLIIYSSPSNMKQKLIDDIYNNNYKVFKFSE